MTTALENNKQVMIFVHSRKETSRTAEAMRDLCGKNGTTNLLDNFNHEQFSVWKRAVEKSRSIELQQLFYQGIFIYFILFYFETRKLLPLLEPLLPLLEPLLPLQLFFFYYC